MIDKSVVEPREENRDVSLANALLRMFGAAFFSVSADHYLGPYGSALVIGLYLYLEGLRA